jgi:hypothetical protein
MHDLVDQADLDVITSDEFANLKVLGDHQRALSTEMPDEMVD